MKSITILALNALFGAALAIPLEKRDMYTTTVVEDVIETVDVVTTVWVQPGDPRLAQNYQQATVPSSAPAVTTSAYVPPQTSAAPAVVPQQNQEVKAAVQAPVPTSSSSPAPAPIPSTTPAVVAQPKVEAVAPVQSFPAPVAVAPFQSSSAPFPSPSTSSASSSASDPSGGSCGQVGGKCSAGDVTTFDGSGGAGSCGWIDPEKNPNYVALAVGMMGSASNDGGVSTNPYCGRTLKISSGGQTQDAMITDKCPGCQGGDQSLDLSPALFAALFDGAVTGNFHNIEWWFTS